MPHLSKAHFEAFMCGRLPVWEISCGGFPGNFQETAKAAAGRMPQRQNGPLRTAPINPGGKTTCRKVPSDLGHLAPLWCNLAHKRVAGNFPETSKKLPGQQPAAPQNLRMGCCALHQSIRGQKPPVGKCPQIWAVLPHCGATWPTSVLREISRKLAGVCPGGSRPHHKT